MSETPEVSVDDLAAALGGGAHLLDVREPDEWLEERVAGGQHIPLGEIVERASEVPSDQPVYVICAAGGRSMQAADYLRTQGIEAINVAGGTKGWVASGKPFASGPAE